MLSVYKLVLAPSDLLACGLLSLVSAENFLKSSPKCLLACVSSGTHGKIQNWRFFGHSQQNRVVAGCALQIVNLLCRIYKTV